MENKITILPMQIGESATCDFDENTWTFEMPEDFKVTAGNFAIVPLETWQLKIEQFDRMKSALEKILQLTNGSENFDLQTIQSIAAEAIK